MEHILLAISVVLPVFLIILVGWFFRWRGIIDEDFVGKAMKIVFNACLPAMLYIKISSVPLETLFQEGALRLLGYSVGMMLVLFFVVRGIAKYLVKTPGDRGTFVQGAFRSNYILIGYPILFNIFGDAVVGRVAVVMIAIIPLYNILAIIVLTANSNHGSRSENLKGTVKKVVTNPLILGTLIGFGANLANFETPAFLYNALDMIGAVGTPLGLIGIGAYLKFGERENLGESLGAVMIKLIVFPLIATGTAVALGFSYLDAAVVYVLFGSPSAISSFIMATALGGNGRLAANIVILGTSLSLVTFVTGLTLLSMMY